MNCRLCAQNGCILGWGNLERIADSDTGYRHHLELVDSALNFDPLGIYISLGKPVPVAVRVVKELVYFLNVDKVPQTLTVDAHKGKALVLHPVHTASSAADKRAATATYVAGTGAFTIPARTAVVFVVN